jgi:hypothetical protein
MLKRDNKALIPPNKENQVVEVDFHIERKQK